MGWNTSPEHAVFVIECDPNPVPPVLCVILKGQYGQELLRIRRLDENEFEEVSLGGVQFVPLVGSEGWGVGGAGSPESP